MANDFVKQYEIAKREGDKMQVCVQAGLVGMTFLQAQDENNYRKWKQQEREDCLKVGIQK